MKTATIETLEEGELIFGSPTVGKYFVRRYEDEVDARIKIDSKGKTPDEWAQLKGFEDWLGYAAWSRHTGGFYETAVQMLKAEWKKQDPEEFARQKKILSDQSLREHSYINLPPEAWPTSFIGNKKIQDREI